MTGAMMQGTRASQGGSGGAAPQVQTAPQAPGTQAKSLPGQPQTAKEIRDNLRDQIRNSVRNGGDPQIVIPNDFTNVVPRGAVDISLAFFFMLAFIIVGLPITRAVGRRMDSRSRALEEAGRNVSPQIAQLQSSIDAMAIELERISESQRFQAKLLAAKDADPARVNR